MPITFNDETVCFHCKATIVGAYGYSIALLHKRWGGYFVPNAIYFHQTCFEEISGRDYLLSDPE